MFLSEFELFWFSNVVQFAVLFESLVYFVLALVWSVWAFLAFSVKASLSCRVCWFSSVLMCASVVHCQSRLVLLSAVGVLFYMN